MTVKYAKQCTVFQQSNQLLTESNIKNSYVMRDLYLKVNNSAVLDSVFITHGSCIDFIDCIRNFNKLLQFHLNTTNDGLFLAPYKQKVFKMIFQTVQRCNKENDKIKMSKIQHIYQMMCTESR